MRDPMFGRWGKVQCRNFLVELSQLDMLALWACSELKAPAIALRKWWDLCRESNLMDKPHNILDPPKCHFGKSLHWWGC